EYVWATSWGVSTRLIGALVMAHSDDEGLVLPPKLAPLQVVIVPIYKGDEQKKLIDAKAEEITSQLKNLGVRVKYDDSDNARPGWKFAEYEMKGVPVRLALGARDLEKNVVEIARRDTKEKKTVGLDGIAQYVDGLLLDIQHSMFHKAKTFRDANITAANSWDEFVKLLDEKAGFISAHWDGTPETEEAIKEKTKATIRCIPLDNAAEEGTCILTGKPSTQRVLFARAY
ncbi:MAG: proline--tRNA ligase, partial [Chitinophagaceae bacterium]